MTTEPQKTLPWRLRDGQPSLLGARCADCGAIAFPPAVGCIRCGSTSLAVVDLGCRGLIESRTRVGEQLVCEIRLIDGPLLVAAVEDSNPLTVGTAVRFEPLDDELRFCADV